MDTERSITLSFNGREIHAAPLKPSQFTALQMMGGSRGGEQRAQKDNQRMYRILELAVGAEEWDRLMDDLADGTPNGAFSTLVEELIKASVVHLTKKEEPETEADDMAPLSGGEVAALEARLAALKAKRGE